MCNKWIRRLVNNKQKGCVSLHVAVVCDVRRVLLPPRVAEMLRAFASASLKQATILFIYLSIYFSGVIKTFQYQMSLDFHQFWLVCYYEIKQI